MHLVGTREPHSLLVGILFTPSCFKLRWPLRCKSVMIMFFVRNAKKAKKKLFPMSAKSTKGTQVLGKALCVASAEFFFAGLQ